MRTCYLIHNWIHECNRKSLCTSWFASIVQRNKERNLMRDHVRLHRTANKNYQPFFSTHSSWTLQQASSSSQGFSPGQPVQPTPQNFPYRIPMADQFAKNKKHRISTQIPQRPILNHRDQKPNPRTKPTYNCSSPRHIYYCNWPANKSKAEKWNQMEKTRVPKLGNWYEDQNLGTGMSGGTSAGGGGGREEEEEEEAGGEDARALPLTLHSPASIPRGRNGWVPVLLPKVMEAGPNAEGERTRHGLGGKYRIGSFNRIPNPIVLLSTTSWGGSVPILGIEFKLSYLLKCTLLLWFKCYELLNLQSTLIF